ncbi:MAG: glycosyltransferase family 4 protein [Candidatus Paceibacterota bacterium]
MKILILSDGFPLEEEGGASIVAFNMAKGLVEKGEEVLVFTTTKNKNSEGESIYDDLRIMKVFSNYNERWRAYISIYNYLVLKKLKKIIAEFKPDVIHAHNIHIGISYGALKIAKRSGAKVFITMHDVMSFSYGKLRTKRYLKTAAEGKPDYRVSFWDNLKMAKKRFNPWRNFLIRKYLRYADKIIAVSAALKEALEQNGINNVAVIKNGIDFRKFQNLEGKDEARLKFQVSDNEKTILFGGRPSAAKGVKQLFEALKSIKDKCFKVIIFGENEKRKEEIKEEAKRKGILEKIIFLGKVPNKEIKDIYKKADLLVVPSVCFDSFPTVILEAMATGIPVIATVFGGAKEMVLDGKTGFIVNPFKTKELAEKIEEVLLDEEKAKKFGEEGKKRAEKEFNSDNWIEDISGIYRRF